MTISRFGLSQLKRLKKTQKDFDYNYDYAYDYAYENKYKVSTKNK